MPTFRDVLLSIISFGLLYWGIGQYDGAIEAYRSVLATAAMVIASLLFAPYWATGKGSHALPARVARFWLAFFILALLSALFANNISGAFGQLRLYFSVFLLGLGFRTWMCKPTKVLITGVLLSFCLVHVLILILVLGYATEIIADTARYGDSVPYHGNIRHVAHHGMVAACAGLALFFLGGRFRWAGYLLGAASIFGLVFLGQRGGLLGMGVFVAVAAYFLPDFRYRIVLVSLLTVLVSVALVYSLDNYGITNRYFGSMAERVRGGGMDVLTGTSGRLEIWKNAVEGALQRPVLGYGPDGFRFSEIERPYPGLYQPHNSVVQVLVEFGITGLVLVFLLLYQLFRQPLEYVMKAKKNAHSDLSYVLLLSILIGFLAFSLVDGLFYHAVPLLIFSVLAPLTFSVGKSVESTDPVSTLT